MKINQYINQQNVIVYQGYIGNTKISENARIVSINPDRINQWDEIQNNMLTQSIEQKHIDIALFNRIHIK